MTPLVSRRVVISSMSTAFAAVVLSACGGAGSGSASPSATAAGTARAPAGSAAAATASTSAAGSSRVSVASTTGAASAPAKSAAAAPSSAAGQITFSHWIISGPPGIAAFKQLVATFQQQQPSIKVSEQTPTGNYWQQIETRLAGGDAPDVMGIDNYNITALAAKGGAMPLDSLIAASKYDLSIFYPIALLEGVYTGKRYGLPWIGSTRVLGYNADLFTKAGLPTPAAHWKSGDWTWDTFLQTAQKLTMADKSGRIMQFGYLPDTALWSLAPWILANGGEILNQDHTKALLDQPKAVQAVSFQQDLMNKYHVAPTPADTKDVDLKASGRVAMWADWRGDVTLMRTYKFNWDVALLPIVAAVGKSALYKGNSMALYSHTKHVDAAWAFATYITGPEANKVYVGLGGASPVSIPAVKDEFLSSTPPKNNAYFLEPLAQNYAKLLPLNPHWPDMADKADSALQAVFDQNRNVQQTLSQLVPQINQILAGAVG